MKPTLAQIDPLTNVQRVIRDEIQRGGSFTGVALVLLGLVGVIALAYFLARREQFNDRRIRRFAPRRLFEDLLQNLLLTPQQRKWLDAVASHARLDHPAVLLLSDKLYDRCVREWESRHPSDANAAAERRSAGSAAAHVRRVLFPEAAPAPVGGSSAQPR